MVQLPFVYFLIVEFVVGVIGFCLIPFTSSLVEVARGPHCLKCGYNLQNIDPENTACPECGEVISPVWLERQRQNKLKPVDSATDVT